MTKFEEEFKGICEKVKDKFPDTEFYALPRVEDVIEYFKNWHSDEEFQELKEQNENQAESILLMLDEIKSLKSQLQQQALPVVPEFVAEWYEEHKDDLDYSIYSLCEEFDDTEPNREPTEFESWFDIVSNQPILTLVGMRNGYTVEKPQLFRVCLLDGRHTLTRRDPRKTLPFNYTFLWSYSSELKEMREINRKVDLFTEQEIKSIDERYWQFAVPVEDGE
ncbi:DUF1642 domain-containing protein [Lactococcus lactis]